MVPGPFGPSHYTHLQLVINQVCVCVCVCVRVRVRVQKQHTMAGALSFWLANTSELLNFLQQDGDMGPLSGHTQQQLSHLVHTAYK